MGSLYTQSQELTRKLIEGAGNLGPQEAVASTGQIANAAFKEALSKEMTSSVARYIRFAQAGMGEDALDEGTFNALRERDGVGHLLSYDDGITGSQYELMAEWAKLQEKNLNVMGQTEGFGQGAISLMAGFAGAMVDPVNLASMAFPALRGEVWLTRMALAKKMNLFGSTSKLKAVAEGRRAMTLGDRVKLTAAAAEAEALAREPFILGSNEAVQQQYGAESSLMNLVFAPLAGGLIATAAHIPISRAQKTVSVNTALTGKRALDDIDLLDPQVKEAAGKAQAANTGFADDMFETGPLVREGQANPYEQVVHDPYSPLQPTEHGVNPVWHVYDVREFDSPLEALVARRMEINGVTKASTAKARMEIEATVRRDLDRVFKLQEEAEFRSRMTPEGAAARQREAITFKGMEKRSRTAINPAEKSVARLWSSLFGTKVRFFDPAQEAFFGGGGGRTQQGKTISTSPDTIFVRSGQLPDMIKVAGHEFAHAIKFRSPETYRKIVRAMMNFEGGEAAFRGMKEAMAQQGVALKNQRVGRQLEEGVNNVLGDMMKDRRFWRSFAKANPEQVKPVLQLLRNMLDAIEGFLHTAYSKIGRVVTRKEGPRPGLKTELTDIKGIEKLYDDIANAIGELDPANQKPKLVTEAQNSAYLNGLGRQFNKVFVIREQLTRWFDEVGADADHVLLDANSVDEWLEGSGLKDADLNRKDIPKKDVKGTIENYVIGIIGNTDPDMAKEYMAYFAQRTKYETRWSILSQLAKKTETQVKATATRIHHWDGSRKDPKKMAQLHRMQGDLKRMKATVQESEWEMSKITAAKRDLRVQTAEKMRAIIIDRGNSYEILWPRNKKPTIGRNQARQMADTDPSRPRFEKHDNRDIDDYDATLREIWEMDEGKMVRYWYSDKNTAAAHKGWNVAPAKGWDDADAARVMTAGDEYDLSLHHERNVEPAKASNQFLYTDDHNYLDYRMWVSNDGHYKAPHDDMVLRPGFEPLPWEVHQRGVMDDMFTLDPDKGKLVDRARSAGKRIWDTLGARQQEKGELFDAQLKRLDEEASVQVDPAAVLAKQTAILSEDLQDIVGPLTQSGIHPEDFDMRMAEKKLGHRDVTFLQKVRKVYFAPRYDSRKQIALFNKLKGVAIQNMTIGADTLGMGTAELQTVMRTLRTVALDNPDSFDAAARSVLERARNAELAKVYQQESAIRKWTTAANAIEDEQVRSDWMSSRWDGTYRKGVDPKSSTSSVSGRLHAARQQDVGLFIQTLNKYGLLDSLTSRKDSLERRLLFRYLSMPDSEASRAISTTIPEIAAVGDMYRKLNKVQTNRLRELGVEIGERNDYTTSTIHSKERIKGKFQEWSEYLKKHLDWDETFRRLGMGPESRSPERVDGYLKEVYDDLMEGRYRPIDDPTDTLNLNASQSISKGRHMVFKADDSLGTDQSPSLRYDELFGSGEPGALMLQQIQRRSELAVIIGEFGHHPRETWARIKNDTKLKRGSQNEYYLNERFEMMIGALDQPYNLKIAQFGQTVRNWVHATVLGNAGISALNDIPSSLDTIKHMGIKLGKMDKEYWFALARAAKQVTTGKDRNAFIGAGAGLDAILSATSARVSGEQPMFGLSKLLADAMFRTNLLTMETAIAQTAYVDVVSAGLLNPKNWDDQFTEVMSRYGISLDDLQRVAEVVNTEGLQGRALKEGEIPRLLPSMLDAADPRMADKLRVYMDEFMRQAVLEPDLASQAFFRAGTQAGTPMGETVRSMTQYMAFGSAIYQKTVRRTMNAYGEQGFRAMFSDPTNRRVLNLASFMGYSLGLAYISMQLKQISKLREPVGIKDWNQQNTRQWLYQTGFGGPLSDLLWVRDVDSLFEMAAGPALGMAGDIAEEVVQMDMKGLALDINNAMPFAVYPVEGVLRKELVKWAFADTVATYPRPQLPAPKQKE